MEYINEMKNNKNHTNRLDFKERDNIPSSILMKQIISWNQNQKIKPDTAFYEPKPKTILEILGGSNVNDIKNKTGSGITSFNFKPANIQNDKIRQLKFARYKNGSIYWPSFASKLVRNRSTPNISNQTYLLKCKSNSNQIMIKALDKMRPCINSKLDKLCPNEFFILQALECLQIISQDSMYAYSELLLKIYDILKYAIFCPIENSPIDFQNNPFSKKFVGIVPYFEIIKPLEFLNKSLNIKISELIQQIKEDKKNNIILTDDKKIFQERKVELVENLPEPSNEVKKQTNEYDEKLVESLRDEIKDLNEEIKNLKDHLLVISSQRDELNIRITHATSNSSRQKDECVKMESKITELNSLNIHAVESYKKSLEIMKTLKNQNERLEKDNENLRDEISRLSLRAAGSFEDLTPRYKGIKQCTEELQLSYPKRQISSIDFIKLLIENIKSQKEEILQLKSSINQDHKENHPEKMENKLVKQLTQKKSENGKKGNKKMPKSETKPDAINEFE